METVVYEKTGSFLSTTKNVGLIKLNRLDALNAISEQLLDDLNQALDEIENDSEVRSVVITADGEKVFSVGADLKAAMSFADDVSKARALVEKGQALFRRIENFPKPVIAAINGLALGGGLELALACDIRIASENAKLGAPEVGLGLIPAWGGTQRLAKVVGIGRAKELILTGNQISAKEAADIGLINKVVPADELMSTAMYLATKISENAPIAVKFAKQAINKAFVLPIEEGNKLEADFAEKLFGTEDLTEGIMAVLEKRKPKFKGQ